MFKLFNLVVEYDDGLLIMDRFDRNKDGKVSISEVMIHIIILVL